MRLRSTTGARALCTLLALALGGVAGRAVAAPGTVNGRLELRVEGVRLSDAGPTIVYLDGLNGKIEFEPPQEVPDIHQRDATFAPDFLAITAGQTIALPNDDTIFHNVFSYSKPNDFDLGLYPRGEKKYLHVRHAGVVRIYCSIHESMSGVIFVAPTPYHAPVGPSGEFSIAGVPPGQYRVRTWNDRLPEANGVVRVANGAPAWVDLSIGLQGDAP